MPNLNTETLDKLYLEWSQFTKAKTAYEIQLEDALRMIQRRAATEKDVESAFIHQVVYSTLNAKTQGLRGAAI